MRGKAAPSILTAFLLLTLVTACLLLTAGPAHARTFGVNSTKDRADERPGNGRCSTGVRIVHRDGGIELECTLRAAIQEANATDGADAINFGIARRAGTNCHAVTRVCTISPLSSLPKITQPATVNGYSQPGSRPNTATTGTNAALKIVLDGSRAGSSAVGLYVTGSRTTVRGLVINNGFQAGVILFPEGNQPGGNKLEGNFIGTDATGTTASPNQTGVFPTGVATGTNEVVGGSTPGARNLISGNQINVNLFDLATVEGNLIGTRRDGTTSVWGPDTCRGSSGVLVEGSVNLVARKTIAFNGLSGVGVPATGQTGNRILGNSIFDNCLLGIDLGGDFAVTGNDPQDQDTGSNRLQNYPVISSARRFLDSTTTISGSLNSTPGSTFTVQFFSSPAADHSGFGEGKTFLGERQVTTNERGETGAFTFTTNRGAAPVGRFITATATNDATGDTSEFSGARVVESGVVDPDPG